MCEVRPDRSALTAGVCWFGPDVAYTTCFTPFPARVAELPSSYQNGDPQVFSRASAWWAFDFVANWARLHYQRMCSVDIRPLQVGLETAGERALADWDEKAARGELDARMMTEQASAQAQDLVDRWWGLADLLVAKYSDGYVNGRPGRPQNTAPAPVGYPSHWLGKTNYAFGPTTYSMRLR